MFLTEEQAEKRLHDPTNLAVRFKDETKFEVRVRRPRGPALPKGVREEIAVEAMMGISTQDEIAEEYGVSKGVVVDAKKKYATSIAGKEVIDAASDRAFDRLMASMGFMTDDKLSGLSAKDLSSVAANMARVVEKTRPKDQDEKVQLIVYVPEIKTEDQYTVIDIRKDS